MEALNKKRTYQMYEDTFDLAELEEIGLEAKVKAMSAKYKNINEIPGVLVSDILRKKTLKELGVDAAPKMVV